MVEGEDDLNERMDIDNYDQMMETLPLKKDPAKETKTVISRQALQPQHVQ